MNKFFCIFVFRLLVLFTVLPFCLAGQDTLNSALINKKTFEFYETKEWNKLINLGKRSLKAGYDYYYLRMRIAIAYFEKKDYIHALVNFEAARKYNAGSELILEYIYYCYLLSGQPEQAELFSKSLPPSLLQKLNIAKKHPLISIQSEGGLKICTDTALYKIGVYAHLAFKHSIAKSISFFHGFSYFKQNGSYGDLVQWQYYLKANIPIKKNWLLSPSFHYLSKDFTAIIPGYTGYFITPFIYIMGQPEQKKYKHSDYYVGSVNIKKSFAHADLSLGGYISNINDVNQLNTNLSISYYPFGNPNFSLGSTFFVYTNNTYGTSYAAITPFASIQAHKKCNLFAKYLYNKGKNIMEENGYVLNNAYDLSSERWMLMTNVNISKHLDIYGIYQFETKREALKNYDYHFYFGIIGIKLNL